MSSMYDKIAHDSMRAAREKVDALEERNKQTLIEQTFIVLYRDQAYRVHNIMNHSVNMYPLSSVFYYKVDAKQYWPVGDITSVDAIENDPELLSVLDQIILNDPEPFYYVTVKNPRHAQTQYFVAQLGVTYTREMEQ